MKYQREQIWVILYSWFYKFTSKIFVVGIGIEHLTLDTSIIGDPDIFQNLLDIPYTYFKYLDYLK